MLKNISLIMLLIVIIVAVICIICREYIKRYNNCYNSIVIHKGCKYKELLCNIQCAFFILSEMNPIWFGLPVTHNFSHWMVLLTTYDSNNYLISSSPRHYVEIIKVDNFNEYNKVIPYKYNNSTLYCYKVKKYNVKTKMNILEYCEKIIDYYNSTGVYNLLRNNCQIMTSYGLRYVLQVDCDKEIQRDYSVSNIIKELWINRHKLYSTDIQNE